MGYEEVFKLIDLEKERQRSTIELIASENFVSDAVLAAVGSCLTNKYAEGYPSKRYYGGCANIDAIETLCQEKWKEVFHTDYHCNVQPHSGSQANCAAYMALIKPQETILSMNLNNGGHLTHGSPVNFSGKTYNMVFYTTDSAGYIDLEDVRKKARLYHPQVILAGASAYPREINFAAFREIADEVGAYLMVDMAHIAGLVAAGVHNSPFAAGADIITTTTHKTLRGPRGGMIFCKPELARRVDSAIFPGSQGGPLEHVIAGKAIAAYEACTQEYKDYIVNVVRNCKAMAADFADLGYKLVTGGTDNHLFLLDLTEIGVTGKCLQDALDLCHITLNKNCVPNEKQSPTVTSGVRIGTAAMTTRGMTERAFDETAYLIDGVCKALQAGTFNDSTIRNTQACVEEIIRTL